MPQVTVRVGRTSGPVTDRDVESDFLASDAEFEAMKDAIALVNAASGNAEKWFIQFGDGPIVVPMISRPFIRS